MGVDAQGRARLIEDYLPLVRSIASRYAGGSEPLEDLVQVGSVGLIKAVDRFEPERGSSLAALARPAIEGEIRHHLRDRTPLVRVPRGVRELDARVRDAEAAITTRAGHEPDAGALAQAVGAPEAAVTEALLARRAATGAPLPDVAAPEEASAEDRVALAQAWATLSDRQRTLLSLRYGEDLSQAEIARRVGSSQASVSRVLASALGKLHASMRSVAAGPAAAYSGPAMDDGPDATTGRQEAVRSGRFLIRMPQSLHDALAREAEHEGVSLNTLITNALAGAVSWRDGDGDVEEPPAAGPPRDRTNRVLLLNLVVVGVVAIAAVILLVLAATQG
ncbi:MAG: sigma-70 family RNA polymerase sigma factor [Solirubrobacteraceae bacterium]